jgi:hypothetical protein
LFCSLGKPESTALAIFLIHLDLNAALLETRKEYIQPLGNNAMNSVK